MTEIEWIQDEIRMETEFPKLVTTTDHNITTTLDDISYRYDWDEISVIVFCFIFPFLFALYSGIYTEITTISDPITTFYIVFVTASILFMVEGVVLTVFGDVN